MQVVCYFGRTARQGQIALPSENLLAASEDFAQRHGLTGLLAVADGHFLHVLEGEEAAVQDMMGRIAEFWNEQSPSILFERTITRRNYQQWNVVISHGMKHGSDAASYLAGVRRFLEDDIGNAADPFRYFLTPNRSTRQTAHGAQVRQVAIFSNSVLWFNPIFSHLSDRFGAQACALKMSSTGREADSYPLDYADVAGDSAGPVRVVGISEGLLASTLSQPLLENIELMVFLMRRSGQGSDTEFVARAMAHPVVQRCRPHVLFVTPGGNQALSDMLHEMALQAGLASTETRGSVLMGGPTWKAIHEQLVSMAQLQCTIDGAKEDDKSTSAAVSARAVTEVDLELDLGEPACSVAQSAPGEILRQLAHALGTAAWAAWIDTRSRDVAARTSNAPRADILCELAQGISANLEAIARHGPLHEMVTTFPEHHEIVIPHPRDAALVLLVFARLDEQPLAMLRRQILNHLAN
ncbi:BLUF domain-containing protein [Diaphorobacter ruginosibacter]|uniref:BLUF domain-containing protein n=1 Tax=Diaphorobacter ruginosibacter TaxID=1715720 RepID=UPI00333E8144